jgi:REP element-mobilizing transposase RayT
MGPKPKSLGSLIAGFKSSVTTKINQLQNKPGEPVWQRNYYEHVIRDKKSLHIIRMYIANNISRWRLDEFYR